MGVRVPPFAIDLTSGNALDCTVFCSTTGYNLQDLFHALHGHYQTTFYRDVIHIEVQRDSGMADVFYFTYGVTVCWGLGREEGLSFVKKGKKFEKKGLKTVEFDQITYEYGDKATFSDDHVILPNEEVLTKLAISHGLAQSVKLEVFENSLQNTYEKTRHIPEHLAKDGKIPLSRKQIRRKMGELFIERNSINLHVNILDKPEFFWDHAELEPLYSMTAYELDLEDRVEVLNQRLKIVGELFEMLGNELNHQHSNRLEWAIIWLIVIEVVLTVSKDVLKVL